MYNGIQDIAQSAWGMQQLSSARSAEQTGNAFAAAMASAWGTAGTAATPSFSGITEVGPTASVDMPNAWGRTDEVEGATLEEMLRSVHSQLTYHVMDCSSSNWIRNDFPHYKLFQENVNKYEIENWRPTGAEPTQANSPASHALSMVPSGSTAVIIHPAVQERMDADPEYAREIFERIEAWFAFDDARNTAIRAAHGDSGSGIDKRAIAIGEDGLITNALSAGSGRLTVSSSGATKSKKLSAADERLLRHDQYMAELVERQIEHSIEMSQQLNAMSLSASARAKVTSMMSDPKLRAALGEKVSGIPLDTMFEISMQHINQAMGMVA